MPIKTVKQISIPKEPNTINVCPALSIWPASVRFNRKILTEHQPNLCQYRNNLLILAFEYTKCLTGKEVEYDITKPVIATGHQPNWHHCGIFIKSLLADQLAKRMDGLFIHIVVDHDTCDTSMDLPVSTHSKIPPDITLKRIKPEPNRIQKFLIHSLSCSPQNALLKSCWADTKVFRNNRLISESITSMQAALYQNLSINAIYLPVSMIADSGVFQDFLACLLKDVSSFVAHYNTAVSTLKASTDISTLQTIDIKDCSFSELPFWLLTPENKKSSLFVSSDQDHSISIACDSSILVNTRSTDVNQALEKLKQKGYSVRPKAVALTLFVRLYLADWFIHGAGGARYEFITDYLLRHFFRIDNLSYGAAALTSFLFEKELASTEQSLGRLQKQQRKFLHSPESFLDPDPPLELELCDLLKKKQNAIICSTDASASHQERKCARENIRILNRKLQEHLPFSEEAIHTEISKLKEQLSLFKKRDFCFGLFSKEYLTSFTGEICEQLQG